MALVTQTIEILTLAKSTRAKLTDHWLVVGMTPCMNWLSWIITLFPTVDNFLKCWDSPSYSHILWFHEKKYNFQEIKSSFWDITSLFMCTNAIWLRGVTLTAANLGFFLNFAQLARTAKFKIEPKWDGVKETPLTEVALQGNTSLTLRISRKRFLFNRTRFPIE